MHTYIGIHTSGAMSAILPLCDGFVGITVSAKTKQVTETKKQRPNTGACANNTLHTSHALTHGKKKPTNEHTNAQNGQLRIDRFTVDDAVPANKIVVGPINQIVMKPYTGKEKPHPRRKRPPSLAPPLPPSLALPPPLPPSPPLGLSLSLPLSLPLFLPP